MCNLTLYMKVPFLLVTTALESLHSRLGRSPCCVSINNSPGLQNPHKCQPRKEGLPVSQHSEHSSGVPRTTQPATLDKIASLQLQVKASTATPYPLTFHMHVSTWPFPMLTRIHKCMDMSLTHKQHIRTERKTIVIAFP